MADEFEWDDEKRRSNIRDHGIDFHDAWEIFKRPVVEYIDDRGDYGEERWIAVGMTGRCFFWSFTRGAARKSGSSARERQIAMTRNTGLRTFTIAELEKLKAAGVSETRADAPEAPELGPEFWKNARVVMPSGKTSVHLRLDSEVYAWFKLQGGGHLTRMNAVLRSFYEANRTAPVRRRDRKSAV